MGNSQGTFSVDITEGSGELLSGLIESGPFAEDTIGGSITETFTGSHHCGERKNGKQVKKGTFVGTLALPEPAAYIGRLSVSWPPAGPKLPSARHSGTSATPAAEVPPLAAVCRLAQIGLEVAPRHATPQGGSAWLLGGILPFLPGSRGEPNRASLPVQSLRRRSPQMRVLRRLPGGCQSSKLGGRFSRKAPTASGGAAPKVAMICWRSSYSTAARSEDTSSAAHIPCLVSRTPQGADAAICVAPSSARLRELLRRRPRPPPARCAAPPRRRSACR